MDEREYLLLGRVKSPVGLKGEIRVKAMEGGASEWKGLKTLLLEDEPFDVEYVRTGLKDDVCTVKLAGVDDRDSAFRLNGKRVMCRWEDAPTLPKDTYYVRDLIGLSVIDETESFLGTVINVLMTKQQCFEIAAYKTWEDVRAFEREAREKRAETDAHMKEFTRKLYENPGAVSNAEKAIKAERRKFDKTPVLQTFLVPFVGAFVTDIDPERGVLHVRNVRELMEL